MKNKLSEKFIAGLMLTVFMFTNTMLTVSAMENPSAVYGNKPAIRDNKGGYSMKLKGDVSYIRQTAPVSISLRDSDVKQVLRMFADKAGMNIIFHDSVTGNVTMDLVDVPLNAAFDMVMEINELNYVVEDNTIIVAKAGTKGFNLAKQDMTLIPVKYISASALAEFLNKNIYSINRPGLSSSDIVTTNPATNELIVFGSKNDVAIAKKVVAQFDKKPETTTFKVNHTTPAQMANMICGMLLPAAGGSTGGAASMPGMPVGDSDGNSSGNNNAVTLNAGTIACTLDGKLDGSVASFGLQNLTVAFYSQLGTISIIGGSEQQIEMINDFIVKTDKKQPQAYLEVALIELNESGSKALQNNWTILSDAFSATFTEGRTRTDPLHPIFIRGDGYDVYNTTGARPEVVNRLKPYSGPLNISYAINYLVSNSKGRVVSNPKIIITNGEQATINITQDYIESTESEQSAYTGGTIATRTYSIGSDAGIKVGITPFISPDGYVTLNIAPEYATILRQEPATDANGDYIAATLLSRRNLNLRNIRIKDGETLVIAGMITEEEKKTIGKVPVLGDIPGIGAMFRSTTSEKVKNEMVIMITPKIITDTEDAVGNADTL